MGCQNLFLPFLVTAKTRCVGRELLVSFVIALVLSIVSPPQWRPRCPFQGRGGEAGLSQAVRRTPQARSCTNAVRKRAAFTATRASAEPGTKRGRLGWRVTMTRKDDDEVKPAEDCPV